MISTVVRELEELSVNKARLGEPKARNFYIEADVHIYIYIYIFIDVCIIYTYTYTCIKYICHI